MAQYTQGDTNKTWLTSDYNKILGRAPDDAGLNANLGGLLGDYASQRSSPIFALISSASAFGPVNPSR